MRIKHAEHDLRKAAHRVAEAESPRELIEATERYGEAQVEWHNAIPRNARMEPVGEYAFLMPEATHNRAAIEHDRREQIVHSC